MTLILSLVFAIVVVAWLVDRAHRCAWGGKQHRFEPRYSEETTPPPMGVLDGFKGTVAGAQITLDGFTARKKTYIHDVCVRCGKVIYTTPPAAGPAPSAEMIRDSLRKAGEEFVKKMSP